MNSRLQAHADYTPGYGKNLDMELQDRCLYLNKCGSCQKCLKGPVSYRLQKRNRWVQKMTDQEQVFCLQKYQRKNLAKICVTLENNQRRKALLIKNQYEQSIHLHLHSAFHLQLTCCSSVSPISLNGPSSSVSRLKARPSLASPCPYSDQTTSKTL